MVALLMGLGALASIARADDRKAAAEHFALAEKAEKRKDWQAAIGEYEQAYAASPHPWALYNIAANYERLGQRRNAAEYFRRYLDESPEAKDRGEVEAKIESLRNQPSEVTITARPASATVWVDGEQRGKAPLTVSLAAGEHEVVVGQDGRRSAPRAISVEYGDPTSLTVDLDTAPGLLVVGGEVDGAEIRLDGAVIGYTPYSGAVAAGPHQLLISKPGYESIQRDITVAAEGSQQIRANLTPIGGPKPPEAHASFLLGMGYGYDANLSGVRYMYELGYRAPSQRWEVSALLGATGGLGGGVGIGGRLFVTTGRIRPYLRAGALLTSAASTGGSSRKVLEGGAGVLISGAPTEPSTSGGTASVYRRFALFLEADLDVQLSQPDEGESRFGVPLVGGVMLQYGR